MVIVAARHALTELETMTRRLKDGKNEDQERKCENLLIKRINLIFPKKVKYCVDAFRI